MRLDLTVAQVLGHFVVMLRALSAEPAKVWRPGHVHVDVCLRTGALGFGGIAAKFAEGLIATSCMPFIFFGACCLSVCGTSLSI